MELRKLVALLLTAAVVFILGSASKKHMYRQPNSHKEPEPERPAPEEKTHPAPTAKRIQASGWVTAGATAVLAVITFFYLLEVREQRQFSYVQLAVESQPEVLTNPPEPIQIDEKGLNTSVKVSNSGGPVSEIRTSIYLICCNMLNETTTLGDFSFRRRWRWESGTLGTEKFRTYFVAVQNPPEPISLAVDDQSKLQLFALVITDYTQPGNPIHSETHYTDSTGFVWHPIYKRWMDLTDKADGIIKTLLVNVNNEGNTPIIGEGRAP